MFVRRVSREIVIIENNSFLFMNHFVPYFVCLSLEIDVNIHLHNPVDCIVDLNVNLILFGKHIKYLQYGVIFACILIVSVI